MAARAHDRVTVWEVLWGPPWAETEDSRDKTSFSCDKVYEYLDRDTSFCVCSHGKGKT
jgi:hypothetical protein